MARFRTIQYMIDPETGFVWSRVESEVAIPVLLFDQMTEENNFATNYQLEKFEAFQIASYLNNTIRTRKISTQIKNEHRRFWGMKPLKNSLTSI